VSFETMALERYAPSIRLYKRAVNTDNGHSWPVTSRLNIRLPVLSETLRGLENQRSVYVSCKTSTPCVPNQIFQVELLGVTVNGVPCRGSS
jgi:hypothetical protein